MRSIRFVSEEDADSIVSLLNPIIDAGTYSILDKLLSVDDQIAFIRSCPSRGVSNVACCEKTVVSRSPAAG